MNDKERNKPCSYRQASGQAYVTSRLTILLVFLVAFKGIAGSWAMVGVLLGETAEILLPNCHRYTLYDPRGQKVISLHRYGNDLYVDRADERQTENGFLVLLLNNVSMADSGEYVLRPDPRAPVESDCNRTYFLNVSIPVPSAWGSWGAWQPCSVTCGIGQSLRRRLCIHGNLDDTCTGTDSDQGYCRNNCSIDGGWSSWDHWTDCTVTCGGGIRNRHRTCDNPKPDFGGKPCDGQNEEHGPCRTAQCPIHGGWSTWGNWSECHGKCDVGVQERYRSCDNPVPMYGGEDCHGNNTETEFCLLAACPPPDQRDSTVSHGGWSSWGRWSDCSIACGEGKQGRNRSCDQPRPMNGGEVCSGDYEERRKCQGDVCSETDSLDETSFWKKQGQWVLLGLVVVIIIILASVIVIMVRRRRNKEPTVEPGVIYRANNRTAMQRQQGLDSHVYSRLDVVGAEPGPPDSKSHYECLKSKQVVTVANVAKRTENVYSSADDMYATVNELEMDSGVTDYISPVGAYGYDVDADVHEDLDVSYLTPTFRGKQKIQRASNLSAGVSPVEIDDGYVTATSRHIVDSRKQGLDHYDRDVGVECDTVSPIQSVDCNTPPIPDGTGARYKTRYRKPEIPMVKENLYLEMD